MIEVTIKGFQSIEEVSFTIDGFTALVGRSNIGKSAVVRAIQSALTNASGTDNVRHGEFCSRRIRGTKTCKCQCSVHLKAPDFDLLWEKGDAVNQYTFNGQLYSRVDRGTPDFLSEFSLVKVGDKKQLIQVADQFEPIFLLNQGGTIVADVLSDVAKLDDINVAMADVERDRRETNSTLKVREKDTELLRTELSFYVGLDDPLAKAKAVSSDFVRVQEVVRQGNEIESFFGRLQELGGQIRALQPVDSVETPDSTSLEAQGKAFEKLLEYEQEVEDKTSAVTILEPVEGLPELATDTLVGEEGVCRQMEDWLGQINTFKGYFQSWKEVEQLSDPPEAAALVQGVLDVTTIASLASQYDELSLAIGELEFVELSEDLEDPIQDVSGLVDLAAFTEHHELLAKTVEQLTSELSEITSREAEVQKEWTALGICPTCSQAVTGEHSLHFDA